MNNKDSENVNNQISTNNEQKIIYNRNKIKQLWIAIIICILLLLTIIGVLIKQVLFPYPYENDITYIKGTISEIYTSERNYIIKLEEYDNKFIVRKGIHIVDMEAIDNLQNNDFITLGVEKGYFSNQISEIQVVSLNHDNTYIVTLESTHALKIQEQTSVFIAMGVTSFLILIIVIKCIISLKNKNLKINKD